MFNNAMDELRKKYFDKKILVVGLGLQGGGVGIARFFSELGAKVTVTDKKDEKSLARSIAELRQYPVAFRLGGHKLEDFLNADIIFKGPSVPWISPEIIEAEKNQIPVEMELSFVAGNYPGKIIGVTGTRGKSTTTNLIYELLNNSGFKVSLGGSLPGISTINCLKTADKDSWLVAELSSWALSGFHHKKISPYIAIFTNFYPDHLNYYKNLEDYFFDKTAIFRYQKEGDLLILNDSLLAQVEKTRPYKSNRILFNNKDFPYKLTYLKGDHNLENAAAALKVAEILKIDKNTAVKIIQNFKSLPYRLQTVGKKDKLTFINDTTSTTPIATVKAIDALNDKKIIIFLGGNSKNLPKDILFEDLDKVEKIILLAGSFTDEILTVLKERFSSKLSGPYDNLDAAINEGYRLGRNLNEECYLLFSPGATSFAMFDNEFHRGNEFNRIVNKMLYV